MTLQSGSYERLGRLIRQHLGDTQMSQAELGAAVARLDGSDTAYPQSTVSTWLTGVGLSPERIFSIERALKLPGGTLSQTVGFVPVGTEVRTVPEAIRADPDLSPEAKNLLQDVWTAAVSRARTRTRQ